MLQTKKLYIFVYFIFYFYSFYFMYFIKIYFIGKLTTPVYSQ